MRHELSLVRIYRALCRSGWTCEAFEPVRYIVSLVQQSHLLLANSSRMRVRSAMHMEGVTSYRDTCTRQ